MKPNNIGPGCRIVSLLALSIVCVLAILGLSCDGTGIPDGQSIVPSNPDDSARPQTAVFADDFEAAELGNWSERSNTGIGLVTNPVHSGRYSFASTLGGGGNASVISPALILPSTSFLRFYLFVPSDMSIPDDTLLAMFIDRGYTAMERVYLATVGGELTIKTDHASSNEHVTRGAWHALEAKLKTGSGSGEIAIYLDGNQIVSSTGLNLPPMTYIQLGQVSDSASGTIFFDDVALSSTLNGAPSASITVHHALPHARSGLRLMTVMWGYSQGDSLVAEVDGSTVYRSSGTLSGLEYPIIDLAHLTAGDHTLRVQLLGSGGVQKALHTETIHKGTNGIPPVSIDAWNNLVVNGKKFFPITTWSRSAEDTNDWFRSGYINASGWSSGWAETYSTQQYQSFLADINCMPAIGPSASRMGGSGDDAAKAAVYAATFAKNPCILMWAYYDEPTINDIKANQARATMQAAHNNDPNHPVAINLYGYEGVQDNKTRGYLYPTFVADVYSFDEYPVNAGLPIRDWLNHLDAFQRLNYGLTPWFIVTEFGDNKTGHPLSAAQLRMEVWLAIIHGVKGITWWDSGDWINLLPENQAQAAILVNEITQLQNVILSPDPSFTVLSDRTTPGARVDVMVRQDTANLWIFAARVTEASESGTPALPTTISVPGLGDGTVTVFGEDRILNATQGKFIDSFRPFAVHIYRIPK